MLYCKVCCIRHLGHLPLRTNSVWVSKDHNLGQSVAALDFVGFRLRGQSFSAPLRHRCGKRQATVQICIFADLVFKAAGVKHVKALEQWDCHNQKSLLQHPACSCTIYPAIYACLKLIWPQSCPSRSYRPPLADNPVRKEKEKKRNIENCPWKQISHLSNTTGKPLRRFGRKLCCSTSCCLYSAEWESPAV